MAGHSIVVQAQWAADGSNISNTNTGNVRVGTSSGAATPKLFVNGDANNAFGGVVQVYRSDLGGNYSHILWGSTGDWYIRSSFSSGKIVIQDTGGNVGIGTSAPDSQYKLDINGNTNITGNINVTGNIRAKYQDLAEWVPASGGIPSGTLVVLDCNKSNHVMASTRAYDTRVAGVIAERPGIALGDSGNDKVLVATTGRVRLKVTASGGPIHVGDLLVTSDIPGTAMKSKPLNLQGVQIHRPGTLIGKALEPLAKGRGQILVLLSLQ